MRAAKSGVQSATVEGFELSPVGSVLYVPPQSVEDSVGCQKIAMIFKNAETPGVDTAKNWPLHMDTLHISKTKARRNWIAMRGNLICIPSPCPKSCSIQDLTPSMIMEFAYRMPRPGCMCVDSPKVRAKRGFG